MRPAHLLLSITVLIPAASTASGQNPNDPGLLDPVIQSVLTQPWRLPSSHQVTGHSEQINIVGKVKRKRADQGKSSTGKTIHQNGTNSPNRDVRDALRALEDAAGNNQMATMQSMANELRAILTGSTSNRIYDGFALLNTNRGGWLPSHVAGEYKTKYVRDRGLQAEGLDGQLRTVWELDVNILYFDEEMDTDTMFMLFPPRADPRDLLYVNYTVYSTTTESFAPTTLLKDVDPFGNGELSSKGYDAAWGPLGSNEIAQATVAHGTLATLRGIQIWGWYAEPDRSTVIQPVWEFFQPSTQAVKRDARGSAMMAQMATLDMDAIGPAAPEMKIWDLTELVLGGASPQAVLAAMTQDAIQPLGNHDQWHNVLSNRILFPQEALDLLALEGIDPMTPGANRLGPYDAILVYANHEMYVNSLDLFEGHDAVTGEMIALPSDPQGNEYKVKVINLDATTHYLQTSDYGPALHDDIATCRLAPSGGHSLEIFVDHPIHGAPKITELQWRLGWSLRRTMGVVPQYDVFTQIADLGGLTAFADENGLPQIGWQYPASDLGNEWRISPPTDWLGPNSISLSQDGIDGVVIGTSTSGFGSAKMPTTDLRAFHPKNLANTDTNGDGVNDALIFPDWLRNPEVNQADLIPTTKLWQPFLYVNPNNGSIFMDPNNPSLGLWADYTCAFGEPLPPGSNLSFQMRRPRSQGQALWHRDGLFQESTGAPSRTNDIFTR